MIAFRPVTARFNVFGPDCREVLGIAASVGPRRVGERPSGVGANSTRGGAMPTAARATTTVLFQFVEPRGGSTKSGGSHSPLVCHYHRRPFVPAVSTVTPAAHP